MFRFLVVFFLIVSSVSKADEFYEFYSVQCISELNYAEITPVGIFNVGHFVNPVLESTKTSGRHESLRAFWRAKEDNLRMLAENRGLYIFGEMYGAFLGSSISCELPYYKLDLIVEAIEFEYGHNGVLVEYASFPKIMLQNRDGKVVFEHQLQRGDSINVADISRHTFDGHVMIEVCTSRDRDGMMQNFEKTCRREGGKL